MNTFQLGRQLSKFSSYFFYFSLVHIFKFELNLLMIVWGVANSQLIFYIL